jgi:hypothetical protein
VATAPDGPHSQAYLAIARKVWATLESGEASKPAPKIVIE